MNPLIFLSFFGLFLLPHPHIPKAIVLQGAGGKTTLTWFTVPYNAEQVKTLPNGKEWHLGFAALDVGMPMQCGDTKIPVGSYKLNVLRDDKGEFSELQLVPNELLRARGRRNQPADPQKLEAVQKDLAARGIPELIHLPASKFADGDAEHLEMMVMNRGFEAVERGSAEPKGGASFSVMATFGDLHRKVDLVEVFEPAAKEAGKDK
jgi:hypothetical protein